MKKLLLLSTLFALLTIVSCRREPELHLYDTQPNETRLIFAELELDTYWDYEIELGVKYDWRKEWYYGWDDEDRRIFGEIGYTEPNTFNIRRYFTGSTPSLPWSIPTSTVSVRQRAREIFPPSRSCTRKAG
ncbi:MAG: hypothetical protein II429_08105, partial [Prevotella sp.]|nr:hypothetical protein [Prevotella sp.]